MSCQICGQRSAPGATLCADCRAARKRAYDATITQPLLRLAGAGTVSRTLSRLRRSDASPEAKARRAARKAQAAARPAAAAPAAAPAAASGAASSRSMLWALLILVVVLAAIAGWYLPNHASDATQAGAPSSPSAPPAPDAEPAPATPAVATPTPAALPPLPVIVERELVPHSPAAGKPVLPKRGSATPKAVPPPVPEAPPKVEIARAPPLAEAPPAPKPLPQVDPLQQMTEAIGRCPGEFLGRVVCEQKLRLQYCEGRWGQVPQCPGGPGADHE